MNEPVPPPDPPDQSSQPTSSGATSSGANSGRVNSGRSKPNRGATGVNLRTWNQRWTYLIVRGLARVVGVTAFDLRCFGRQHLDFDGAALLLSTHQSTLDPVMIGVMKNDELCYLARKTLFKSYLFAALIRSLNAIEIDRESGGLAGLKETLKRLKAGEKVLIFPEGTRTSTGQPAVLKPGFIALARRGSVPLVPMAVTGAFHALKRGSILPTYAPLCVYVGPPIEPELVGRLDDQQLLEEISQRLWQCHRLALTHTARATRLQYS